MRRWILVGAVCLLIAGCSDGEIQPADPTASTRPTSVTTTTPTETTTTIVAAEPITVSGTRDQGFEEVESALADAKHLWQLAEVESYAYLLEVVCDCPEAESTWVRRFGDWDEYGHPIDDLFDRISLRIADNPESIEVSFAASDGHPIALTSSDQSSYSLLVNHYHRIDGQATEYDGSWRFLEGTIKGEAFANPPEWTYLNLETGRITFPPDGCNEASGWVDIYNGGFALGPIGQTLIGCETPAESTMFNEAMYRVDHAGVDGAHLVLTGPDVELHFTTAPETPSIAGELPLTFAGDRITFDPPSGATAIYIVTSRLEPFGRSISFLLTAETSASEHDAGWTRWTGQPAEAAVAADEGPHTIVIPDEIQDGDHYLCSPYWLPDPFCYTLWVRPPSAPWFVTAGLGGVVLHDANGTSEEMSAEPAAIAFYVNERLVAQYLYDMSQIQVEGTGPIKLAEDERLEDVTATGDSIRALVIGPGSSTVVDLDTGEGLPSLPHATEGKLAGDLVVLRTSPDGIGVFETATGEPAWDRVIGVDTLVTVKAGLVRLDTMGVLQTEAGPPYFQYVETETVDLETGEALESFEWEVAIPDDGHNIDQPCGRPDFDGDLLICPQPDGRLVTLEVVGGESRTFATGVITATFARDNG